MTKRLRDNLNGYWKEQIWLLQYHIVSRQVTLSELKSQLRKLDELVSMSDFIIKSYNYERFEERKKVSDQKQFKLFV